MNALACPLCGGLLKIEHYNIKLPKTQAFGVSSRLICTKPPCIYKKEPKKIFDPRVTKLIQMAEKDEKGLRKTPSEKKKGGYLHLRRI